MQRHFATFATGFLFVQVVVGYEWFASGLTKIVHGDFPAGLAADLHERARQSAPWYGHVLRSVVTPHARGFGYAIELAELFTGVVLIVGALIFLVRGEQRIGMRLRLWITSLTGLVSFAGLLLAINFALANRAGFSPVAADSFDETISLDALLVGVQVVLLGVAAVQFAHLVGTKRVDSSPAPSLEVR